MMSDMSEATQPAIVPQWTLGDRLGKALAVAGISVGEISTYLGLSRNSVSAYINDRQAPKRQTLLLWSMRTGVPLEWLEYGDGESSPTTPPTGGMTIDTDAIDRLAASKRARSGVRRDNRQYDAEPDAA